MLVCECTFSLTIPWGVIFKFSKNILKKFVSMTDNKNDKTKVDLGLLEEDDEFEEFPAEDWTAKDEDSDDISVWEDNWDDDDVEDDFNQQLRAQLEKQKATNDAPKKN